MDKRAIDFIRESLDHGDVNSAVEEARRWLAMMPSDPQVMLNVGGVFIDAGRISDPALVKRGTRLQRTRPGAPVSKIGRAV